MNVVGSLITAGPVRLRFSFESISKISPNLSSLGALADILDICKLSEPPDRPGAADRINLRDAIIALDGERAGVTRREIANIIYGADYVATRWTSDDGKLKAIIRRDLLRGKRFVQGEWRRLIAGGTFRLRARNDSPAAAHDET